MIESNDVKEIQIKIKRQIDELEEKVKNSKTYWNHKDLKFDKHFVQNFIDGHYNEIVHHLNQIKHHLEKINYHKSEIEDIQLYLAHETDSSPPEVLNDSDDHTENNTVKRAEEDKIRFKSRRLARSTSLKYVLQWEKMLDEQNEDNSINVVKRRPKSTTNASEEEGDVSKIMVKNRVLQFEGIQKPKRISSTYETFLDFSGEKPKRVKSYPILEESEDDNETERPRSFSLGDVTNSCEDIIEMPEDNLKSLENSLEHLEVKKLESSETIENIIESRDCIEELPTETPETFAQVKKNNDQEHLEEESIPLQNQNISEDSCRRPRIVEVHLKQPFRAEVNSQVPLL